MFCYLDLNSLKTSRLVSRLWSYEAARNFTRKIKVKENASTSERLEDLVSFVQKHQIRFSLQVELLYRPWAPLREKIGGVTLETIAETKNNMQYVGRLFESVLGGTISGFLTELRVWMVMVEKTDALILVDILSRSSQITHLYLEFFETKDEAIYCLPLDTTLPPTLHTLGYEMYEVIRSKYG